MSLGSALLPARESTTATGIFATGRKRSLVFSLLLVVATLCAYRGIERNGFINVDDNAYLINNDHVHAGLTLKTVKWALTTYEVDNWHPLTWMLHELDWELFGRNTGGHHYVSVLFHALNAVLLFLLLEYATGFTWRSFFVAAIFAVHPVNVESVAWAAELKTVLSMLFFLLAMMAYTWYAQQPSNRRYGTVAVLFALGLMAKPQIVTFPFVLLLWDYWPLQRFGSRSNDEADTRFARASFSRLVLEKIPLLMLAAADVVLTMRAQDKAVYYASRSYGLRVRIPNAVVSYVRYVGHALWPLHLSPAYTHPGNTLRLWQVIASVAFLSIVTLLAVVLRKKYLLVGWLWFLGILVPMIGIVQVGDQAMADRYAYNSFIGLFWIVAWGTAEVAENWRISPRWLAAPAGLAIVAAGFLTTRQVTYWHDGETLWRHALVATPDQNFLAHSYLAGMLTLENKHEEAIQEYLTAEKLHWYPLTQIAYFADYELRHDHRADAMDQSQRVLQGTNDPAAREMAYRVLGIGNTQLGKPAEARENYQQALAIEPHDPYALMGMGLLAYRESDFKTATDYFSRTVEADPSDFDYLLLATALRQSGRETEATAAYASAQRVSKDWTQAQDKAHWFLTN